MHHDKPIVDRDALRRHLLQHDQAAAQPANPAEPEPQARPCPAPVRPGWHNAAAARRLGCEDEWIDRINARYGGEW